MPLYEQNLDDKTGFQCHVVLQAVTNVLEKPSASIFQLDNIWHVGTSTP
jgi:hypothetical protein